MIRIFKLVLLLVVSQVAFGQAPSNYTNINGRYRWIAGMFDSTFHIPKGTTPSLRTGGSTNSGGLFYNTSDSSVYTYTGTQWIKVRGSLNPSDTTNKYITQVYKKSGSDSVFYVKGGIHTWAFNDSTGAAGGGGGGKIYYFNGGVNMGTFGGLQMYELGDTANTGAAANFTRNTTGGLANFITDPGKPGLLQIPAGVWTIDAWLSESGGGSNSAQIWVEVEKWDGSTITTIAISPIEEITEGSTPNLYTWSVSIPTTPLAVTDRIVVQFYITNTNGKTVTLYTQNGYVGEIHTTFTTGIGALNGLTAPAQYLVTGTAGTDFNINSVTATHTFNLPTASATNRGALSSADWTTFNNKLNISDTASMLSPYLRKVDTASLSNRINLKLNISDTATMLNNYVNNVGYGLSKVGKVVSADSATLASYFLRRKDSLTSTNLLGYVTRKILADSTAAVRAASGTGTVTSVGSNTGTGLTGGPITTSGTLAIDTITISTRRWRQKGIDSVQSNLTSGLALKVNISDTASMLSPYLRSNVAAATYVPQTRTITINGTSQDLSANRTFSVGTVTSVGITAGTGISVANSPVTGSGNITVTNTAPDQTVALTAGTGITIGGTYPSFTITNSSPSSGGTVTSVATNNGTGITGGTITGAGTLAIDTVVISTRAWRQKGIDSVQGNLTAGLALKLNISDTANMLNPYLRKVDTASLSNRINTKLNISDTATMLGNYVNNVGYGLTKAGQLIRVDSATLASTFLRRKDSLTATNLLGYVTGKILADTAAAIRAAAGGGSIGGSGTTNRLAKFTASGTIGNSSIADSSSSVAMTISSGGNLGLGVIPNTWNSSFTTLQIKSLGAIWGSSTGIFMSNNNYNDGANKYIANGFASRYYQASGQHIWEIAASGTANGTITFTEALNLTTAGNFGINTGGTNVGSRLQVNGNAAIGYSASTAAPTNGLAVAGNVGIGTSSPGQILHIVSSSSPRIQVEATTNSQNAGIYLQAKNSVGTSQAGGMYYIPSTTTPYLGFYGDNTNLHLAITSGGLIGIGTTTIGSTLQVNGNAAIGYSASTAAPTNGLVVSGNVGIGTTAPSDRLTVRAAGTYQAAHPIIRWQNDGTSGAGTLVDAVLGYDYTGTTWHSYLGTVTNHSLAFRTNNAERMRITSGGNVGIGTTSPASALSGSAKVLAIVDNTTSNLSSVRVYGGSSATSLELYGAGGEVGLYGSTAHPMVFSTNSSERMRITSGGLVGIGTTTIGSTLQVNGNAAIGYSASTAAPTNGLAVAGSSIFGTHNGINFLNIERYAPGNPYAIIRAGSTDQNVAVGLSIQARDANGTAFDHTLFDGAGNVGIGTTSPSSTLHTNGSVAAKYVSKTATYTLDATDYTVVFNVSSAVTANLPDATTCTGRIYVIKVNNTTNTSAVTIDPNGAQTIDGNATYAIQCQYGIMIQSDGSNWRIIADFGAGLNCL